MNSLPDFKKYAKEYLLSEEFYIFALSNCNRYTQMSLRHILLCILMLSVIAPARGQSSAGSSIVSRTVLSGDGLKAAEHRVYDNGLGDVIQEVQSWPGSSLPSLTVRHDYDDYRRKTRSWLPVTLSGSDFVSGNTISYQAQLQYGDSAPFSRTEYDGFLPSQPSEQYKAGSHWQSNGKKVSVTYSEYVGAGMYSPEEGYLYITANTAKFLRTLTVDEDGCWSAEYTDLNGRVMISETSQGKTYYMYDPKGDITHVIPPILSDYLISHYGYDSSDIPDDSEMMQKYAYIYRYDNQRHCIYRKLPGCDPVYYVYDRTGDCILTQDGEQRQAGVWAYSIPDRFGRPAVSGICHNSITYTAEPLHAYHVYAEYDGASEQKGGYTVHNLTLDTQTLYAAAYYDGYGFIGQHGVPSSLASSTVAGFSIDTSLGCGLQTGSAAAVIKEGSVTGYTYSAMYYDSRYRVSQVRATNHLGGTETTCTSYSYTGKPENVKVQHSKNGTGTMDISHTYTYDDADRMATSTFSITQGVPPLTATLGYEYDALGRLSGISRPFTSGDVTYTYDLHGWTTGITAGSFQEELSYADGPGTPCWNGNVSSMRWKNYGYSPKRGYRFIYDDAGRLTQALYGEGEALASNAYRFSESLQYDAHGNVTGITRRGKISSNSYGLMDNLTLTYDGNQLTGVSETASDYDFAGSFEYKRLNGSEYIYNSNGSLSADRSRGIAWISYDLNNNPQAIYFMNGNEIRYTYSASGEKLCARYYMAVPNVTRTFGVKPEGYPQSQVMCVYQYDYLMGGTIVLWDGMTDKVLFDGGYAKATRLSLTNYGFDMYYYNKDHLGNNREVVNASGSVHQVTNYYPFGAPYADPNAVMGSTVQPFKYNGKELDTMHGLNTYDYGARQYYSIVGRWDRIDPLCEKYYSVSPYVYCMNNPINAFDPDGKRVRPIHKTSNGTTYYKSPSVFRQAMIAFGKTTFGHQLLADFTPKGSFIFGVKGNGRYSDYDLNIYEFDYTKPGEQAAMLSNGRGLVNGQTQLNPTDEGKPSFDIIIDAQLGADELLETICHEFCIHLSGYSGVLDVYKKTGNFDDAREKWDKETGNQQHKDFLKGKQGKLDGTKNYFNTVNEIIKSRPKMKKTFDEKYDSYENEYK